MAFGSLCEFSFMVSKRVPRNDNLSLGKIKKSHGAISGEYGAWLMISVEFLVKICDITNTVWAGELSWCKIHEFSFHKSDLFANGLIQTTHNIQIILIIDRLTIMEERFIVHHTTNIEENSQYNLDFEPTLAFSFRFRLAFEAPFGWLLFGGNVKFINLCLITSYDAFNECEVTICVANHLFGHINTTLFLNEIQLFWQKPRNKAFQTQNIS